MRNDLKINEAFLIIDFSQNYTCKYSEQIQAAHFGASQKQLSLHTDAFFYENNEKKCMHLILYCIRMSSPRSCCHMDSFKPNIRIDEKYYTRINYDPYSKWWPFYAIQEYNKFFFEYYCNKLDLKFGTWNFIAPGHGKSVADGIGGTVKNYCDRLVAQGKDILSAKSMVDQINTCGLKKIKSFVINKSQMEKVDLIIKCTLKPAPNTNKIFQIILSRTR